MRMSCRPGRTVAWFLPAAACSGCGLLGALHGERVLGAVFVIALVAAVGFLASRASRR